jgi:hypothetical protein
MNKVKEFLTKKFFIHEDKTIVSDHNGMTTLMLNNTLIQIGLRFTNECSKIQFQ